MHKRAVLFSLTALVIVATVAVSSANILQSCTPGFFKNHTQFIQGATCSLSFDANTTVSALGLATVDSCVGNLTLLQALSVPSSYCGTSQLDTGDIIMLRQGITRILNATNSNPPACSAINPLISRNNTAVSDAIADDSNAPMITQATIWGNLNNDSVCTIGQ